MGRVQGGARAAFATPSWGPARMMYFLHSKKNGFQPQIFRYGLFINDKYLLFWSTFQKRGYV